MITDWIALMTPLVVSLLAAMTNDQPSRKYWAITLSCPVIVLIVLAGVSLLGGRRPDTSLTDDLAGSVAGSLAFIMLPTLAVFAILRRPDARGRRVFSFIIGLSVYLVVSFIAVSLGMEHGLLKP